MKPYSPQFSTTFHPCTAHTGFTLGGGLCQRCPQHCHTATTVLHPHWEGPDSILGQGIDGSRDESPALTPSRSAKSGMKTFPSPPHTAAISPACSGTETNKADFHSEEHRGKEKQRDIL